VSGGLELMGNRGPSEEKLDWCPLDAAGGNKLFLLEKKTIIGDDWVFKEIKEI